MKLANSLLAMLLVGLYKPGCLITRKQTTQHGISILIMCQIKGEYQFTYLEHVLCVVG